MAEKSNGCNSCDVPIVQKLVKSIKGSHGWYVDDLAKRKKKFVNEESKEKLVSLNECVFH